MEWFPFKNPKNLLLLDCVGAAVTALVTGLLLTMLIQTGLPTEFLLAMAAIAALFACFGLYAYCYEDDASWPLATIGILNLIYCTTAIITCFAFASTVTMLGVIYFALESAIMIPLAALELAVARHGWLEKRKNIEP